MDDNELFSGANNAAAQGVTLEARVPQIDDSQLFEGATQAAKSEQPAKQFNLSAEVRNYLDTGIKYAQSKVVAGQHDVSDSLIWAQAMAGTMKYEDALNQTSDEVKNQYYSQNIEPIEKTLWLTDPRRIVGEMAQAAPYITTAMAGGGATALVGGAVGSAIPGAGTITGVGVGMTGGTFTTASILATGSMYGTLRKQGVPHEAASQFAANYGAVAGALNSIRFMGAHSAAKKAYESQITGMAMKMAEKGAAGRAFQKAFEDKIHENFSIGLRNFLKEVGMTQVLPAELNEIAKAMTESWATGKWDKMDLANLTPHLLEAFKQSLLTGVGFVGSARAIGGVSGFASSFKKFVKQIDDTVENIKQTEKERSAPKEDAETPTREEQVKTAKETISDNKEFIKKANERIAELQKQLEQNPDDESLVSNLKGLRKDMLAARVDKRKAEYRLARETINDMIEGAKAQFAIEHDEKLTDYRNTRKLLTAAAQKADIPDAHKTAFMSMIAKVDTFESLTRSHWTTPKTPGKPSEYVPSFAESLNKRLDAMIEMDAKKEAMADLKNQLGQKVIVPAGKKTRGDISYDAQLQFQRYRQLVKDELESETNHAGLARKILHNRAMQAVRDAENADAGNPYGLKANVDSRIAADVIGLKDKSSEQITEIANRVNEIVIDGANSYLSKVQAAVRKRETNLKAVIKEANGEYPVYKEETINGVVHKTKQSFSDDARRINSFGVKGNSWDMIVKNMFQDSKNENAHFLLDIHDAVQAAEANTKEWRQKFFDMATNGDPKLAKAFEKVHREAHLNDEKIGKMRCMSQEFTLVDGEKRGKSVNLASLTEDGRINRNILMKIRLAMLNAHRAKGLIEGNKLTYVDPKRNAYELKPTEVSTQALIDKILLPEEKQICDNISKFWNQSEWTDLVQSHHIDEYEMPLRVHDNYDGSLYRHGDKPDGGSWLDVNNEFNVRRSVVPDSLIETKQSDQAYRFEPLTTSAGRQINKLVNWMEFRKTYKDILFVLKDKEFREIINTKFDGDFMQIADSAFQSIVGQRGISIDNQFKLAEIYNANAAAAFTTAKIPSAFAQYAGIINVMQEIGPIDTAVGITDFFVSPVKNIKTLMGTNYMKNRAGTIDNFLKESEIAKTKTDFTGSKAKLTDWLAFPMRSVDQDVHMIAGWAVYKKFYDDVYVTTKDKEMAHAAGIGMFERVMNRTQGSAMADQITSIERGGPFQKGFMTFFKQPLQAFNYQVLAWKRYMADPSNKNLMIAVRIGLAARAAQAIFELMKGTPDLASPDVEEKDKDKIIVRSGRQFITGPQPPGFSHLADAVTIPITNKKFNVKERPFEANLPFLSAINSVKELGELAVKTAEKGDMTFSEFTQGLFDISRLTPFATKLPVGAGAMKLKQLTRKKKGASQESDEPITIKRIPEYEDTGEDDGEDAEQ